MCILLIMLSQQMIGQSHSFKRSKLASPKISKSKNRRNQDKQDNDFSLYKGEEAILSLSHSCESHLNIYMFISEPVRKFLSFFQTENPGVLLNLARLFQNGRLGGTGHILILAVDQGFEHGPSTFLPNPEGFSPDYHFELARDGGISAYTAPLNWIKAGLPKHLGEIPFIVKLNHSNFLSGDSRDSDQALVASVHEAIELGAIGIGFTLYPGSHFYNEQLEELHEVSSLARKLGLFTLVWAYPRGKGLSELSYKEASSEENDPRLALDTIAYSAHMACLAGAHIVKVNLPQPSILRSKLIHRYQNVHLEKLKDRIQHIVSCCFNGQRGVLFSGGSLKKEDSLLSEIQSICQGGGYGSVIGRNIFQRPRKEALSLIDQIIDIYLKASPNSSETPC